MKVYVVQDSPYHDNGPVLGVYLCLAIAKSSYRDDIFVDCDGTENWGQKGIVAYTPAHDLLILEFEIKSTDPIEQFALAVLERDPSAVDAVKDILKL